MAARHWFQIASWHITTDGIKALCGRAVEGPLADTFPADEKTCETCLRKAATLTESRTAPDGDVPFARPDITIPTR